MTPVLGAARTGAETTPLLLRTASIEETGCGADSTATFILAELIGARGLALPKKGGSEIPYCIVEWGEQVIHISEPSVEATLSPIWTLETKSLFCFKVNHTHSSNVDKDIDSVLTIQIRARHYSLMSRSSEEETFLGKTTINLDTIVENCTEERLELHLKDNCGQQMGNAILAMRFRVASKPDLFFLQASRTEPNFNVDQLQETGLLEDEYENRKLAEIIEEEDVEETAAARIMSGLEGTPADTIRVKPFPDPEEPRKFITCHDLNIATQEASRHWVEAGSGKLGRLYVEILSCHDLPNLDFGSASVGNISSYGCCAVFEDAVVKTPVISNELSPHWPCWSQRAFSFRVMHPSSILFLGVFSQAQSSLLQHTPAGRVEINLANFQRSTVYNLKYDLCPSSDDNEDKRSIIRIRLRLEIDDERAALLAVIWPPPEIYVNVKQKKNLPVVRYTCNGEYDNDEVFSLNAIQGYIDELMDGFLRRLLYVVADAVPSLIFWHGQVKVCSVWLPLHSLILFGFGVTLIERPAMIPGLLILTVTWIMLANMHDRIQQPSPWQQCNSFSHYFRILILGTSAPHFYKIDSLQGSAEALAKKKALKERIKEDQEYMEEKEAHEKRILKLIEEAENQTAETKAGFGIPSEVAVGLGKLQGIVAGIFRILRKIDGIITWEESAISFWITIVSLVVGVVFLFLPWAFILLWLGRVAVWGCLGPHMKLVDYILRLKQTSSDERKYRRALAKRMLLARQRQEEVIKIKSFRSWRYGYFSTMVPDITCTARNDPPLFESDARFGKDISTRLVNDSSRFLPGQQLYGKMIPRPRAEWIQNQETSFNLQQQLKEILKHKKHSKADQLFVKAVAEETERIDEGLEVAVKAYV